MDVLYVCVPTPKMWPLGGIYIGLTVTRPKHNFELAVEIHHTHQHQTCKENSFKP